MTSPSDFVLPLSLEKSPIRGRLVRLKGSMQSILERHKYPSVVNQLLAELVALAAALADLFKFEGIFTLQVSGDGPIRLMVVDITYEGEVRACARFDEEKVLKLPPLMTSVYTLFGTGHLAFTIDQAHSEERYQGVVDLSGSTFSECLHHFFRQSDQLETGIIVFAREQNIHTDNHLSAALIIQRMPPSSSLTFDEIEKENDAWLRALSLLGTATAQELLSADLTADDILFRLFWEEGVRVFEKRPLMEKCRCSEKRIKEMLQTFTTQDIDEMAQDGAISVTCEFCSQHYRFDPGTLSPSP